MKTWMRCAVVVAFVPCCLAALRAQGPIRVDGLAGRGKGLRGAFEQWYPPGRTHAVVVRGDLPTIALKGSRESGYPIEIDDVSWKGPGSMFRAKPVGNLAIGEVMKVASVEFSGDHVDLRLVSVDDHEIVVDPNRPERNRREQVVTRLRVPHDAGLLQFVERLDAYVRLFPNLDAAREYAGQIRDPQPDRRFTLGVVRRDGILVPFASYDNGHWYRRWPLPSAERDVPLALADVPAEWWGVEGAMSKWTMWTLDGASRPLQVAAPEVFGAHCMMNVGLQTNYRTPLPRPPLDQHHYPKDGIATTGSVPIETVSIITSDTATWKAFEPLIAPHVSRMEVPLLYRIPMTVAMERSVTPVKLEVLCLARGRSPDTFTAYFEASRRYPPSDTSVPNPCGIVTFAYGWAHRAASGVGTLDRETHAQVTDCSMWDVEFRRPLGVVRVGGTPIWIVEVSRWGAERYELVQVTDTGVTVLLSVPGGWCKSIGD